MADSATKNGEQGRLYRGFLEVGFSRVEISRMGIGGISSPVLGVSPGIGDILRSDYQWLLKLKDFGLRDSWIFMFGDW